MKPFIIALIFGLFLIGSAYLSENTLAFFKANKHDFSQDENLSFVYGWVKTKGEAKFFIQQGYRSGTCMSQEVTNSQDLEEELNTFLNTHFPGAHLMQVEQAGCFDNLIVLNYEKKRLMKNKKEKDILKLAIPRKRNPLAGS